MVKWLQVDGTLTDINILGRPKHDMLALLQGLVAGYIECVTLEDGWCLIVNEEGLIRNFEKNLIASVMTGRLIVGDAVILTAEETAHALN